MFSHNQYRLNISAYLICLVLLILSSVVQGVEIVRLQIDYDSAPHIMDIELFDGTAPLTVQNYLDHITSLDTDGLPKYNDTFIYRNLPGFVLQMGGYTFRPPDPSVDALIGPVVQNPVGLQLVEVGPFSPVNNEFNLSNIRGTIAMAKIPAQFVEGGSCVAEGPGCTLIAGTGADSATTEWFINLGDNTILDTQNSGFTVFGSLIDDGLVIADEISTFPDRPFAGAVLGEPFNNLPVVNYDLVGLPAVLKEHLVMITSISQITRPILRFTPENVDFSLDVAGDGMNPAISVSVQNTGNETLNIDPINAGSLTAPLSIASEDCSNTTLDPVSSNPTSFCTIDYLFSPTIAGLFVSNLPITYTSVPGAVSYSVTVNVSGEGVPQTPVATSIETSFIFEDTIVNNVSDEVMVTIRNKGGDPLTFSSVITNGIDNSEFAISNGGCDLSTILQLGETCNIKVTFNPITAGGKTAEVSIQTNGGNLIIPFVATAIIPEISVSATHDIIAVIGKTKGKLLVVTNSGTSTLSLTNAVISGPDASFFTQQNICPDTNNTTFPSQSLDPNGTCEFLVQFSPTSLGTKNAILTIDSNDPINPSVTVNLSGEGTLSPDPLLSVDVTSIQLDDTIVSNTSAVVIVTVTSFGGTPLTFNAISINGANNSDFTIASNSCVLATPLLFGDTCEIGITFNPTLVGAKVADLIIQSDGGDATVSLNGTATAPAILVNSSLNIAALIGNSSSESLVITNTGSADLIINSAVISGADSGLFTQVNDCPDTNNSGGATSNLTPDGGTCSFSIGFSPSNIGTKVAILTIDSNDPINPSVIVNLTGEGIPVTPVISVDVTAIQLDDTIIDNTSAEVIVTVSNIGGTPLTFSAISINGVNNSDFTIASNSCVLATPLLLNDTCEIGITFNPTLVGAKVADLIIQSDGGDATISLNGIATMPELSVNTSLNITAIIGNSLSEVLIITNVGSGNLIINSAVFSGADSSLFTQVNNCPNINNSNLPTSDLTTGGTCLLLVKFSPISGEGDRNAILTIDSNDPVNPTVIVSLSGTAVKDFDGVPTNVETNAPNNGDSNNDEIPDLNQSNVASLVGSNSRYITFISDKSLVLKTETSLTNVTSIATIPAGTPDENFDYGLFSYSITVPAGDGVNFGILLDSGDKPKSFYKYGPTTDNITPHWYDFSFDNTTSTGAKFFGVVSIESPSGVSIEKNLIIVSYIDGSRGDDDMINNGTVLNNQSGISFTKPSSSDSGSLYSLPFLMIIIVCLLRQLSRQQGIRLY